MIHLPVLQKEVLEYLVPKPNENFIDCTIGDGGHGLVILELIGPNGKLLGLDWDEENIHRLKFKIQNSTTAHFQWAGLPSPKFRAGAKFKNRLILINDNFVNLKNIVERLNFGPVSGILLDLGMSSWHLEKAGRGFSFLRNEPLDMRYNKESKVRAEKILNEYSEEELRDILEKYGEERFARRISEEIIKERKRKPIKTTFQLVAIIKRVVPIWYQHRKIHPATRTFQALRIAVNDELNNLEKVLPQAVEVLRPSGRLVVISFHSLEDRIVKNFLKEKKKENIVEILTKKVIKPQREEIEINPRSRSAKLRACIKI